MHQNPSRDAKSKFHGRTYFPESDNEFQAVDFEQVNHSSPTFSQRWTTQPAASLASDLPNLTAGCTGHMSTHTSTQLPGLTTSITALKLLWPSIENSVRTEKFMFKSSGRSQCKSRSKKALVPKEMLNSLTTRECKAIHELLHGKQPAPFFAYVKSYAKDPTSVGDLDTLHMLDSVRVADCNLMTLYLIACNPTANVYNVTKSTQMLHGGGGRGVIN